MAKFVVTITRTETYVHKVITEAKNAQEACRKVENWDDDDGFCDTWNELQPDVDTEYQAQGVKDADMDPDDMSYMEVVQ